MAKIKVDGMHCPVCVKRIGEALKNADIECKISLEEKTVSVNDADVEKAKEEIEDLGFEV